MAPYAYLKEYFLDSEPYDSFHGYVPFICEYYDQFQNSTEISKIYSNGKVEIGIRD
jgi:hypothetical protein